MNNIIPPSPSPDAPPAMPPTSSGASRIPAAPARPVSRRTFLRHTGSALAAGTFLNLNPSALGANERLVLALIGGNNQGRAVALGAIRDGATIKTFCDIDEAVLSRVGAILGKAQGSDPGAARDFRRVLEDKDIDAVIIATPDHWHALPTILACQAGKDVYIEKPLSHTIHEGHRMRDAARHYNRVVQVGTQRRSSAHFRSAIDYVASGKLGKICLVKAWMCQVRGSIGNPPDEPAPAGVDYDQWLGPAPKRPFNKNRFHYTWRFFWDYGNAELGNQGVHMLDVALWGIQTLRGVPHCLPSRVSGTSGIHWLDDAKEVPDTQVTTFDYGDLALVWELHSFQNHLPIQGTTAGTAFYGTNAALVVDGSGWKVHSQKGQPALSEKPSGGSHTKNFLDCIRSRQRPNADIELGRLSTTLCHLGNICSRLEHDLHFDPKAENFGDDKAANALLTKEYRAPYGLPKT
ncbi:MAG: Gfo/Idh/MocA family oxidoreductase [Verrucomicrobia bacterium]|nr:Gfo/Idh/MocA family oxidoreductase [Verrucomicrobiota bacterium]